MDIKIKKNIKVGKDTIENAEYFIFDVHEDYNKVFSKKNPTIKDRLEDFWWDITRPFRRVKLKIRDVYWEVRYGFQRMFNGYDFVDTFSTYSKFIDRYSKVIIALRNNHWGYPCNLSEEEWNNILDEMIYHLHYMNEDNVEKELEKDVPKDWNVSPKTINEIMEKHKDEFFKLFSEYFYNLWD